MLAIMVTACGNAARSDVTATDPEERQEQSLPEWEETSTNLESHSTEKSDTEMISENDDIKYATELAKETGQEENGEMIMKIGEIPVQVIWENNEAVQFLRQLVEEAPLLIEMSMYGGFEQVGPIGQTIPNDDEQITTKAGDIVLYSGNQMVVFYGSNSWAYTRLGHISDKSEKELTELLGNGNVTITLENGGN